MTATQRDETYPMMWERDSDPSRSRFKTGGGYLAYEFAEERLLAELRQIIDRELAHVPGESFMRMEVEFKVL